MLRIAHLSDTHVLSSAGAEWSKLLFNKRLTGYANLVLHRGRVHRRDYLLAVLANAAAGADHVVVTGDITNLALESEYEEALALLDGVARSVEVTVVPGNHDIYLPSIGRERRFPHHFRRFVQSDLPDLALDLPAGPYPCVKLRGPAAIIALSSAVPRPPFIAAGRLGDSQLAGLARVLEHPEVARRMPVILVHHPPVDTRSCRARLRDGLLDAAVLRNTLGSLSQGLVLFGHLHLRVRCLLHTTTGVLHVIGASGAAVDHTDPSVRAGYNRYDIGDDGSLITVEAHVIDAPGMTLRRTTIPQRTACA
jgi:3',5'-cyclic AMP phosphodiesterase CpdA